MGRGLRPALAAGLVLAATALAPTTAQAQERYRVTIAARDCPSYQAITANLRRNDIQESLQDLGPNTLYTGGQPVDPDLEAQGQPLCTPLTGWQFRFGRNYETKAVSGPWGSLARVTDAFDHDIVTRASTPLLNSTGGSTGRSLAGAVTIDLTSAEFGSASQHDLWLQGGLPNDPVLYQTYPDQYAFGALRCAIDNLNGDNVEYVAFPQGTTHVFCFAYYVSPAPTAGTIVVRKEVDPAGDPDRHGFQFGGSLSYNPGGAFSINAGPGDPGSVSFIRAAGTPWTVREAIEPGWALQALDCTSQLGSVIARPGLEPEVTVTLVPGDVVTCTFRDGIQPPVGGLSLGKVTIGATGVTDFRVAGGSGVIDAPVETTEPRDAEYLNLSQLPPGEYRVSESPRDMEGGRWVGRQLRCGGRIMPFRTELTLTVPPGAGVFCLWTNEFLHAGSIRVRKVMLGDTGETGFTIRRVDADPDSEAVYQQQADVRREGVPVTAEGDSTDGIPIGTYEIQETTPSGDENWRLESVMCNGVPVGSAQGRVRIRLTGDRPDMTCTFTDRVRRSPPGGGGAGGGDDPSPRSNLRVTKRVRPTSIVSGQSVRYRVVVTNTSRVTARDVVVAEVSPPSSQRVEIDAPRGVRCRGRRPARCVIGTLRPGRRVVLRATYRTLLRGRVVNRVAVHTSTAETRLSDNRARAVLQVAPSRPGACPAARALC